MTTRIQDVTRENEALGTKVRVLEHSISEMADRCVLRVCGCIVSYPVCKRSVVMMWNGDYHHHLHYITVDLMSCLRQHECLQLLTDFVLY